MATYQNIELQKKTLNEEITGQISIFSEALRNRLGKITAYQEDFEKAFGGFIENSLPQDALYKQIEKQFEDKKKGKGADKAPAASDALKNKFTPKPDEPVLPNPNVTKEELKEAEVAKMRAEK